MKAKATVQPPRKTTLPQHILEKMDGMDARPTSLAPSVEIPLSPRLEKLLAERKANSAKPQEPAKD